MLVSLILFIIGFTMGGLNYVVTVLQARARGMTLMRMPLTRLGHLHRDGAWRCSPSRPCSSPAS